MRFRLGSVGTLKLILNKSLSLQREQYLEISVVIRKNDYRYNPTVEAIID